MIDRCWIFHCGYARMPRASIIEDGGWELVRLPFLCGVAEHREYGPVLIDAPYGHEGPSNVGSLLGSLLQRAGVVFYERWSVIPRLEQLGLRAADVSQILMTHLHYDHTGGMKALAHAQFHMSRPEWEWANDGAPWRAGARGYARPDFGALKARTVLYDDIPHLADSDRGLDVFDDGSIEMFFLPGHTPGHCGYRLHIADGSVVFFVGDAVYTTDQIDGGQGYGLMPRTVATSMGGVDVSRRAIHRHIGDHPDDFIVPSHDLQCGARCIDDGPLTFGSSTT